MANEDTPQLYLLCGRGPRSSVRVLRHGLEVSEMAVSELPGNPNAVWTVKKRIDGKLKKLICSFLRRRHCFMCIYLISKRSKKFS